MSDLSKNQQSIDTSGAHVDGGDVEALRAKFEQRMLDDGWSAGELDWKGNHYAYPGIQDVWELYQAGHAAGVNKMVAAEVGEPVAWGWVDTMIGEGHRLMMVKINHHNDGVAVPLYTASQLAAAVAKERDRCLRIVESVDNHSNPMTANDCADAIRAGAKEPSDEAQ